MSVIESKLTFFKMIVKGIFLDSTELREPYFSKTPEAFNPINMASSPNKFVLSMVYSKMFFPNQPIHYNRASHLNELLFPNQLAHV